MTDIELPSLRGRNPLGLFAALGALDIATRTLPEKAPTLRWTTDIEPTAVMTGPDSLGHLIDLCDRDRQRWEASPILCWGPDGTPMADVKMGQGDLRRWLEAVADNMWATGDRASSDLLMGLVSEGGRAKGKAESKPTHLCFTTGQQGFLSIARACRTGFTNEDLLGNLSSDSWSYVKGQTLRWDTRPVRPHALTGTAPTNAGTKTVRGIEWLAFLALRYFPTNATKGRVVTTGCTPAYTDARFTWPLWKASLSSAVVSSVLADGAILTLADEARRRLGIASIWTSPIQRIGTSGGYGNFGAPAPWLPPDAAKTRRRSST